MNILRLICLLLILVLCATAHGENETAKLSAKQHYQVGFISKLDPIVINTMHAWIIHIENKMGEAVLNAELNVVGGMPDHNHGLPTHPQITKDLGNGGYLLEGMKFHMGGWWQVTISIREDDIADNVTFDLNL